MSPQTTRHGLTKLIKREVKAAEAGHPARITMKMNSLVDQPMIEALYGASTAGVDVDLVIRGICCLRPGRAGPVRADPGPLHRRPVPRALPHLPLRQRRRLGAPRVLIGSADLMPRNLDRRVEALVPVLDPALQARIDEILEVNLADDVLAWLLGSDGVWSRIEPRGERDTHVRLQQAARERKRRS